MSKSICATFDGEVLRPEETNGLEVNERYLVIVENDDAAKTHVHEHPLTILLEMATDMGVDNLAPQHDFYAHGRDRKGDAN